MTMNVYTDPKLLDVHGALDTLPTLDLNPGPKRVEQLMRATGTDCRVMVPASTHALKFVAPDVAPTSGKAGHFESFPVISSSTDEDETQTEVKGIKSANSNKKASFAGDANKALKG